MSLSLYERLGGQPAILAAVTLFYAKVMDDEITKPFFQTLDMDAQVKKQAAFMTYAFGGPADYKGRDLREAHSSLVTKGLTDTHFDAVARHLKATLEELGIEDSLIREALVIVGSTRSAVLGR